MKKVLTTKNTRGIKRDLFTEIGEGITALAEARRGKRTLRTHAVKFKPAPQITVNLSSSR